MDTQQGQWRSLSEGGVWGGDKWDEDNSEECFSQESPWAATKEEIITSSPDHHQRKFDTLQAEEATMSQKLIHIAKYLDG